MRDTEQVVENLLKVARHLPSLDRQLLSFTLGGLNESFNRWDSLSDADKEVTIESFIGILRLSEEGKTL